MSAPVLTISEQKASISGKKKKKKTIKNVLTIPNNLKSDPQVIHTTSVKALVKILNRLLPTARIPVEKSTRGSKDLNEHETQKKTEAKNRRKQLSLGVNSLNRNIKKDLISTALLADNIQPKFLIHHLNLLCNHKKIPYLHMPGLREITKNCLGFPCIAVGFKKKFCDFSEAVEEIKSISKTINSNSNEVAEKNEVEEIIDEETDGSDENDGKSDETPFTYLYRTSTKERIFVPEKSYKDEIQRKEDVEFISVEKYNNKSNDKNNSCQLQLSLRIRQPVKKIKKLGDFENIKTEGHENMEVPKKKSKKNKDIYKKTKQNIKLHPANLMRFPSNPDRKKKNK